MPNLPSSLPPPPVPPKRIPPRAPTIPETPTSKKPPLATLDELVQRTARS